MKSTRPRIAGTSANAAVTTAVVMSRRACAAAPSDRDRASNARRTSPIRPASTIPSVHSAVRRIEGWVEEGVTDLDQEAEIVAGDEPQTAVRTLVRFKVGDEPKVSAMRWRVDEDGTVFRVTVGAAPHVPAPELRDQADAVMASLRRLNVEEGGSGPAAPKKPWWKIW